MIINSIILLSISFMLCPMMLWHFYGLQGGGKTWGATVFAEDFHLKEGRKVYANYKIEFGELIDFKKMMNFEYEHCVLIVDEAYGVADSHKTSKANDTVSYVNLQARKKDVDGFWITQLEGDLYKRIRDNAHRKVLCQNTGTDDEPILRYYITDSDGNYINSFEFDTLTVRSAYHLYDTYKTIMPMYLSSGVTFDNVKDIKDDSSTKSTFITLLNNENQYLTRDICSAIYDLMDAEKYDRVRNLLRIHENG